MGTVIPIKSERTAPGRSPITRRSDRHFLFTPPKIDALIRSDASGYFYDTKTPGLAIRVGATKAVFVHALRVGGAYQRHTLGNVRTMLLADARQAVAAAIGGRAKGEALPAPRQARKAAQQAREAGRRHNAFTLQVAFDTFLDGRELKPKTRKTYEDVWQHVPATLRSTPFADVDAGAVADLHRRVGKSGKQRSANKLVGLLRVIFNALGRRAGNPAAGVKLYRETPRSRRLTPDEAKRLCAVLAEERQHCDAGRAMIAVFCSLAYFTGARRSSLLAMRWDDLDLRGGQETWIIPAHWSKNSTELAVALAEAAASVLTAWLKRCPSKVWVF